MSLLPLISKLSIDGRSLHRDHQRAAVAAQLDVAEEAGVVQRAQRLAMRR